MTMLSPSPERPDAAVDVGSGGPFDPDATAAYARWRDEKLERCRRLLGDLVVEIEAPTALSNAERQALSTRLRGANMAFYACRRSPARPQGAVLQLAAQLGMRRLDTNPGAGDDGVTSLCATADASLGKYVPYTSARLNWHTDGYYNCAARPVRAFVLHCARPATSGGDTAVLDHEIAYVHLRDADVEFVRALMAPDAMTIPANVQEGHVLRPARAGPVFVVGAGGGRLRMRYTARKRHVVWKPAPTLQAAASALAQLLASPSPYIVRHRLEAGQGLICNNVLHTRSAFRDDPESGGGRLVYRARYLDHAAIAPADADEPGVPQ